MSVEPVEQNKVVGCVLCGGKSRRMGGADKASLDFDGISLLEHVSARLQDQVQQVIVSVNEPSDLHKRLELPLLADELSGHLGPLAGIHAALSWAEQRVPDADGVMTVAVDTPFFPADMVERLLSHRKANNDRPVICSSGERDHFALGLWPVALAGPLKGYLLGGGRSIKGFFRSHPPVIVSFDHQHAVDPFFNINTPEDIPLALEHLAHLRVQ